MRFNRTRFISWKRHLIESAALLFGSEASDALGGPREGEVTELCLSPAQATNKGKKISMLWRYFNAFELSTFFIAHRWI
jgi:hypothetical protein